jgi:hypothetical protein
MKLSDIILTEGVNPRELDKYIEELVQLLKDGKEVQVPAAGGATDGAVNVITQDRALRMFLFDRINSYVKAKGNAFAGIEGIKTDSFHKVPYISFKLSDEELAARKDRDQGMQDYFKAEREAGRTPD